MKSAQFAIVCRPADLYMPFIHRNGYSFMTRPVQFPKRSFDGDLFSGYFDFDTTWHYDRLSPYP